MPELPEINKRVKILIEDYANGNVTRFVKQIDFKQSQKVNRLFLIDKRSQKFPLVSTEIIMAICNRYPVNLNWLFTGESAKLKETD